MRLAVAALPVLLFSQLALAANAPDRDTMMDFIRENQLDSNLYNLLAATVPSTPAGQAIYEACGPFLTEDVFENGYTHVLKELGETWRSALIDVYSRHLTTEDLASLSALQGDDRQNAIAETLTVAPVVEDLRSSLSALVVDATELQLSRMLDEVETVCKISD